MKERKCWFRVWVSKKGFGPWQEGMLFGFSTDSEETSSSVVLFPVGIVMDEKGAFHSVLLHGLSTAENKPVDEEAVETCQQS